MPAFRALFSSPQKNSSRCAAGDETATGARAPPGSSRTLEHRFHIAMKNVSQFNNEQDLPSCVGRMAPRDAEASNTFLVPFLNELIDPFRNSPRARHLQVILNRRTKPRGKGRFPHLKLLKMTYQPFCPNEAIAGFK